MPTPSVSAEPGTVAGPASPLTAGPLRPDVLLGAAYPDLDDAVFASGTLVEGIGNDFSDIDVYVITDRVRHPREIDLRRHLRVLSRDRTIVRTPDDAADVYLIHTLVKGSDVKIDAEFRMAGDVGALIAGIGKIFDYAARNLVLLTKTIENRDKKLIHRLLTGHPLQNADACEALRASIDLPRYLYLAYRWVACDFSSVLDILGACRRREWDRAVDMARENLLLNVQGYLHLCGMTNAASRKWLYTYIGRYLVAEPALAMRLQAAFLPETPTKEAKAAYVEEAFDLVDRLLELGAARLAAMPIVPSGNEALRLLREDARYADISSRYGQLEYEYRARAYGFFTRPTKDLLRLDRGGPTA